MPQATTNLANGLVPPSGPKIDPNKGLAFQPGAFSNFIGNIGNQIKSQFQLGGAQAQADQSKQQEQNVTNQLNTRLSQGSLANPNAGKDLTVQPHSLNGLINAPKLNTGNPVPAQNPYSNSNYYAAHPDANPANNQGTGTNNLVLGAGQNLLENGPGKITPVGSNTYNGGVNANGGTFPGYVAALGGTASQPTGGFTNAQNTAQSAATNLMNSAPGQNDKVAAASKNIQDLQDEYAKQTGIVGNSPIGLSEQGGEQGLLNSQYGTKLAAAQTGLQNTLQGNAQEQAAFTGAGNIANSTQGAATSQQGTQQSGLGAAAGLSQPQQAGPTNLPFNPLTGQYGNPAAGSYGSGGLQSVGNIQGQIGVGQNVAQLNSALGGAQVVGNNLNNLITSANINPSGLSVVNGALQFGANQLGNPQYQQFQGQINDFINSIAPILGGPGGATTDFKTQLAGQIVNSLASGQDIKQVVQYFLQQAQQKIQGLSSGGGAGVGQNQSNGTTNASNIYNF